MDIETETQMNKFINKYNYLVIFPDKNPKLFKSLRDIEDEISVAASTISKKLKESNSCICQSKGTAFYFFVHLIKG
jgi:hypothetical protein|uniref:Uncharacterized protein n=1 Tax=viral metagenome TaxID=1070528 RepID=A0A6C0C4N2_9ZZZZ